MARVGETRIEGSGSNAGVCANFAIISGIGIDMRIKGGGAGDGILHAAARLRASTHRRAYLPACCACLPSSSTAAASMAALHHHIKRVALAQTAHAQSTAGVRAARMPAAPFAGKIYRPSTTFPGMRLRVSPSRARACHATLAYENMAPAAACAAHGAYLCGGRHHEHGEYCRHAATAAAAANFRGTPLKNRRHRSGAAAA